MVSHPQAGRPVTADQLARLAHARREVLRLDRILRHMVAIGRDPYYDIEQANPNEYQRALSRYHRAAAACPPDVVRAIEAHLVEEE